METDKRKIVKKKLKGVVVSSNMKDTAVILVDRYVKHKKYGKYYRISKKYLVHDKDNTAKVGNSVEIESTRPISKRKSFILIKN